MKKLLVVALAAVGLSAGAQVKVANGGNVGIGYNNPTSKLHVVGNSFFDGNVGIGLLNPTNKLHVIGNSFFNGSISIGQHTNNTTSRLWVEGSVRISDWTDIVFDWSGKCCGSPVIYPSTDWYLQLGKLGRRVGSIYAYEIHSENYYGKSDERMKENITLLENPIEKIMRIFAYSYNFKEELYPECLPSEVKSELTRKQIGFIAQELEVEFPELVRIPESDSDFYSINYMGMIPVLLEGIKAQQNTIESQQVQINQQQAEIDILQAVAGQEFSLEELNELRNSVTDLQNDNLVLRTMLTDLQNIVLSCCENTNFPPGDNPQTGTTEKAVLYQNTPNPFTSNTEILCYIPQMENNAFIYIYNLNGIELMSFPITQTGYSTVIVDGSVLPAGMYFYTLVVDGTIIDTKRMILTR